MAGVKGSLSFLTILSVHVFSLVLAQDGPQFLHYNFTEADLKPDGMANTDDGLLQITNDTMQSMGHAFHKIPLNFTASSPASYSFSTEFAFAIFPLQSPPYGHGIAFVMSPSWNLSLTGDASSYLGLFSRLNDNKTENHILAIELDTNSNPEAIKRSNNHVGIDINSIVSVEYKNASFFNETERRNHPLLLASGKSILIWIDYDGIEQLLNVTLAPVPTPKPVSPFLSRTIKPSVPLLSRSINVSEIFNETMFVGFSGSTGSVKSNQYILGWSFKKGGMAESLDISKISDPPILHSSVPLEAPQPSSPPPLSPSPPPSSPPPPSSSPTLPKDLVVILSASIPSIAFLILLGGIVYLYRKKKYAELFEQWEKEYSPQRYSFKNLYKATKGFSENQLLGAGGFGKVYKGELPDGTEIAVKRVCHDAEQGMRQYVAEIASMGKLKHKNLVQLLGYWSQRLNIIKGVASALLYIHEDWEQVVLHRDIKASNILLDAELNGRLGDFGLARFHDRGVNLEASRVVGTIGYMAPELTAMGVATTCTDVYAFGAFMLEVVCGRRPVETDRLPEEAKLLLNLGMLCSQSSPENRPTMREIIQSLEGTVPIPDISFENAGFSVPNITHETVKQMATTSTSANFSFEDITVLFGGR